MTKIIMYGLTMSPPCRAVSMVAELLGIEVDYRDLNLLAGEHLKDDFLKINPQHTIPTIDDDGFYLWESHAIMTYLVAKYGKNETLYPKEPRIRAVIDQRMYFDASVLFSNIRFVAKDVFFKGKTILSENDIKMLKEPLELLEPILKGKQWLAGENFTLADISMCATMGSAQIFISLDLYPNLKAWYKRCEQKIPGFGKHNSPGVALVREKLLSLLANPEQYPLK